MKYDGVTIHRDWIEQARLMFQNENQVARAVLALIDFALYDKTTSGRNKLVQAFIVGCTKSIYSQRTKYSNLQRTRTSTRTSYTNTNTNTNTNTTSDKDEEERKKILERIKNQNNGNK